MKMSNNTRVGLIAIAISVWALTILVEADAGYTMIAILVFSSLIIFTGPSSREMLEREVSGKQQIWVLLFVVLMIGNGVYSRMTGKPIIPDLTSAQLKCSAGIIWLVTIVGSVGILLRGRGKGRGEA